MTIGDDRHEGLSPAGPAEDAQDGNSIPEEAGSQVLQRVPRGCLPNAAPCGFNDS